MVTRNSLLVSLVKLVDGLPMSAKPEKRGSGKPKTYSESLIMKALVIMIVRRLYSASALLSFLDQADGVSQRLRGLLCENGKFPSRRTWERRLEKLPAQVRFILGDTHYNTPDLRQACDAQQRILVATRRGIYPHTDDGVDVRRLFHKLRSQAIEPFNNLFKSVFSWHTQMPVKGLQRSQLLAFGAIFVYQLVLLYQHEHNLAVV